MKKLYILLLLFFSGCLCFQPNKGKKSEEIKKLQEEEFFCVDLKKFLNWTYDEKEGEVGWIGGGYNVDLEDIPKGLVKICDVPFYIYSPAEKQGKCIIGVGTGNQIFLEFPLKVGPIPIGKKANILYFLHSSAWLEVWKGEIVGFYKIVYKDGQIERIKLRRGYEIEDWWYINKDSKLENAKVGWTKKLQSQKGREVGTCIMEWKNPYPEKEIKEIIIEGTNVGYVFVFAITGK